MIAEAERIEWIDDLIKEARERGYRQGIKVLVGIGQVPHILGPEDIKLRTAPQVSLKIGEIVIWTADKQWMPIDPASVLELRLCKIEESIKTLATVQQGIIEQLRRVNN